MHCPTRSHTSHCLTRSRPLRGDFGGELRPHTMYLLARSRRRRNPDRTRQGFGLLNADAPHQIDQLAPHRINFTVEQGSSGPKSLIHPFSKPDSGGPFTLCSTFAPTMKSGITKTAIYRQSAKTEPSGDRRSARKRLHKVH